jgi:hypothetical protein
MKKEYINPEIQIMQVELQRMMAGSDQDVSTETPKEWASREGRGFWDDEDEY